MKACYKCGITYIGQHCPSCRLKSHKREILRLMQVVHEERNTISGIVDIMVRNSIISKNDIEIKKIENEVIK